MGAGVGALRDVGFRAGFGGRWGSSWAPWALEGYRVLEAVVAEYVKPALAADGCVSQSGVPAPDGRGGPAPADAGTTGA
ncbi:hypothetical protein ACH41H_44670 [Streptomyces sp. NPDC020800]|uniref:hypothetical protein n=1 Tax=Streptomyces sp. NPDC020800 TaxID=3365092 RepID=UPI0037AC3105